MANLVNTGLGGSRMKKESEKDFYWKPELLVPGSGVAFELVDIAQPGPVDTEGRALYAQSAQTKTAVQISTTVSGYTGTVTVSGAVFTVTNGIITAVA
jgi:hypothetical protein